MMKKMFEMPTVNVERFDVTDVVTASGFNLADFVDGDASTKGSFDYFKDFLGGNDTRLG